MLCAGVEREPPALMSTITPQRPGGQSKLEGRGGPDDLEGVPSAQSHPPSRPFFAAPSAVNAILVVTSSLVGLGNVHRGQKRKVNLQMRS